jgi:hypothetical protein
MERRLKRKKQEDKHNQSNIREVSLDGLLIEILILIPTVSSR